MSKKINAMGMGGKSKGRTSHWGNTNKEVKKYSKKARRRFFKKMIFKEIVY
jgi:hypothetical protein